MDIQSCDFGHRSTTQLRPLAAIAKSDHLSPRIADNRSNRREPSRSEEDCLPKSVAAERMDPFETYPESHVAGVDVLMKYCAYLLSVSCARACKRDSNHAKLLKICIMLFTNASLGSRLQIQTQQLNSMSLWFGETEYSSMPLCNLALCACKSLKPTPI